MPLAQAFRLATRNGAFRNDLASPSATRAALRTNGTEDLAQTVGLYFVEAVARGGIRASECALKGWIWTVTWRTAPRAARVEAAFLVGAGTHSDGESEPGCDSIRDEAVSRFRRPDEIVQMRHDFAAVEPLIAKLAPPYREVVLLMLADTDPSEIGRLLGLSAAGGRTRVFRALDQLHSMLQPRAGPRVARRADARPHASSNRSIRSSVQQQSASVLTKMTRRVIVACRIESVTFAA
ncbi:MAG: sigma-70 family RNA polymerase sigma factor [Polyangiales bacterium]